MANLPEKNITLVDKITSIPSNSNLFLNADGEFRQASVNDVIKSATVVSDTVNNAINDAMQDSIDSHFKQATGSPILLTDTADGTLLDFKGKGRSTQKQYSGKNLLKPTISAGNASGVTFTKNSDGSYTVNGTNTETTEIWQSLGDVILADEDYIVSSGNYGKGAGVFINGSTQTTFDKQSIVSNSDKNKSLKWGIGVKAGVTLNNVIIYPQLEVGTVATDYEPYVGGVASPSPDYPQKIESVADGGYFDGELLQGVYSFASGVFSASSANYVCSKNPIPCNPNDKIVLKYDESVYYIGLVYYDENLAYVGNVLHNNKSEINVTVPSNAKFFRFNLGNQEARFDLANAKHITVTINGKYALIVKSKGKNLLNINERDKNTGDFSYTEYTNEIVKGSAKAGTAGTFICSFSAYLENGKTYFFSQESTNLNSVYIYSDRLWGNSIGNVNVVTAPYYTHKADSGTYIIGYYSGVTSGTEYSVVKPMLRRAEVTDTTYEPYKETVTYIPLNEPLRSSLDGSVKDEVSLTGVTRRFKEVVFDGSDDEVIIAFGNDYPHLFRISVNGVKETRVNVICTHFLSHRKVNSDYSKNMIYTFNDHILINHMDITTVAEFKAWLQANPITVQYELAEPIIEKIEPVDIVTYDNVTYLTASDNADMELEYPTSKVAGIASIGYSKGRKAEYEVELLKAQLLELQTAMVNSL